MSVNETNVATSTTTGPAPMHVPAVPVRQPILVEHGAAVARLAERAEGGEVRSLMLPGTTPTVVKHGR